MLRGFLGRKTPEIEILDLLNEHLELCVKSSDLLVEATIQKKSNNTVKSNTLFKKVSETEETADYLRREILNKLAKGILPPISKQDMIELTRLLDNVIDWVDKSGILFNIIDIASVPEIVLEIILEQIKLGNQCVHSLRDTIKTLYKDYEEALDKCNLVEIIEHEMDDIHNQINVTLYRSELTASHIMILKELSDSLEMIGDSCEDTADLVRVVVVSAFR